MTDDMTRYFYDTEFLDDGTTIELISIGICADDGREYYAVNSDFTWDRVRKNDWMMDNVVRHLPTHRTGQVEKRTGFGATGYSWGGIDLKDICVKPKWVIANEVRHFLLSEAGNGSERHLMPELWAYYSAYDHVVLAQLWGPMISLPKGIPMWTHDLMQLFEDSHITEKPAQDGQAHDALDDARWNKLLYDTIIEAGH